jgi:hypothetical protein
MELNAHEKLPAKEVIGMVDSMSDAIIVDPQAIITKLFSKVIV